MAKWDSAALLSKLRTKLHRPTADELATTPLLYELLTEAEGEVMAEVTALAPTSQMGAPVLLTSADGGVTYTFGTDDDGERVFPLACEVYATAGGHELHASSWDATGDFVVEGDRIRMPRNEAVTFDSGPYARFVRADNTISASSEPILKPPPARMLIVLKAAIKFAGIGSLRDPQPWQEEYDAAFRRWITVMRTQFADATGVANEGLVNPTTWFSYGRL